MDSPAKSSSDDTTIHASEPDRPSAAVASEVLERIGLDSALSEDQALALLKQEDLTAEALELVSQNPAGMRSRKGRLALAAHPHAPRHISLRLVREFYTFDLVRFALLPVVAADLKRAADELLVSRLASVTLGERISLARRASGIVGAALLPDKERRVWQTALENARLTEAAVVRVVLRSQATPAVIEAVSHHGKWSLRQEV